MTLPPTGEGLCLQVFQRANCELLAACLALLIDPEARTELAGLAHGIRALLLQFCCAPELVASLSELILMRKIAQLGKRTQRRDGRG
jgi:hypothetical protein